MSYETQKLTVYVKFQMNSELDILAYLSLSLAISVKLDQIHNCLYLASSPVIIFWL